MGNVIAAVRVGQKRFRAIRDPFHRTPHLARGPQADDLFRVDEDLRAEAAADVGRDNPQFVLRRDADECGNDQPRDMRVLRRIPEREMIATGIVVGNRRARFDRIRHQAVVDDVELGDMLGGGKGRVRRLGVAKMPLIDRVAGDVGVNLRRVFGLRLGRIDHGGEHLVVDFDFLGSVAALRHCLGDHHRDRVADAIDLAGRERRMRRHLHRRAVLGMDHPAADQIADLVGGEIGAGEHVNHARHFLGRSNVDALDLGVGMRRAHEHGAGLARPHHVIGVLSVAGDKSEVFLAAHRRADPGRAHGGLLPLNFFTLRYVAIRRPDAVRRPWPCSWPPRRSP